MVSQHRLYLCAQMRPQTRQGVEHSLIRACLLYTSDAADERSSVDLGGRRIIKKKTHSIANEAIATQTKTKKTISIDTKIE